MRHKKALLILTFLARFSMAIESNPDFVFNEGHFREIYGIAISGIAPNGRLVDTRPVPIIFAERHGITQEQFAEAVVTFAKDRDREGNHALAAKALGTLSHSPETNSVPYLVEFALDKGHRQERGQLLYALLYKAPERFAMVLKQFVWDAVFDDDFVENERYEAYRLMSQYCRLVDWGFSDATIADEETLLLCLRELADLEKYDRPRWWIDHTLCDHLDGWKFSEDRVRLLREWEKTRTSQDERFLWGSIADDTEEAIQAGKTEWVLYKDRPRPPKPPLNPDGSLKAPESPPPPPIDDGEVPIADP